MIFKSILSNSYLCTKDLRMKDGTLSFKKNKCYHRNLNYDKSELCLIDEQGSDHWAGEWKKYFVVAKRLKTIKLKLK